MKPVEWVRPEPPEDEFGVLLLRCRETGEVVGRVEGTVNSKQLHDVYAFSTPPGGAPQRATFSGRGEMPWLKAKEWVAEMATHG